MGVTSPARFYLTQSPVTRRLLLHLLFWSSSDLEWIQETPRTRNTNISSSTPREEKEKRSFLSLRRRVLTLLPPHLKCLNSFCQILSSTSLPRTKPKHFFACLCVWSPSRPYNSRLFILRRENSGGRRWRDVDFCGFKRNKQRNKCLFSGWLNPRPPPLPPPAWHGGIGDTSHYLISCHHLRAQEKEGQAND